MSVLLFPTFTSKLKVPPETTGEFLGANLDELEQIAGEIGVAPLSTFGDNREVPKDFDGPPWELDEVLGEWNEWFDPGGAIPAVVRLRSAIAGNDAFQERLEASNEVMRELEDLEMLLRAAHEQGCEFRFEISY